MYIDGDEILQNADEIIEFFNSGEFKKYGSASFEIKNFLDKKLTKFSMFSAMRLFRHEKNTRWYGKIHEHIKPIKLPTKNLNSVAFHYGYVHENNEERLKKHERNIKPMLEIFEKDPKDARNIAHLARELLVTDRLDDHKKYLDIGLKLFTENTNDIYYHALYQQLISYFIMTHFYFLRNIFAEG